MIDDKRLQELAEVCQESFELAEEMLKEIRDTCEADPALRPYWRSFANQFGDGQEIPPHRIKGFVAWLISKNGGSLVKRKHMRLVYRG